MRFIFLGHYAVCDMANVSPVIYSQQAVMINIVNMANVSHVFYSQQAVMINMVIMQCANGGALHQSQ